MSDTIRIHIDTVGDLLDRLAEIAKDPQLSRVLDSTVDGSGGEVFTQLRITTRTLSDKSKVLDFELEEES